MSNEATVKLIIRGSYPKKMLHWTQGFWYGELVSFRLETSPVVMPQFVHVVSANGSNMH